MALKIGPTLYVLGGGIKSKTNVIDSLTNSRNGESQNKMGFLGKVDMNSRPLTSQLSNRKSKPMIL